jgi:hypothetical protein
MDSPAESSSADCTVQGVDIVVVGEGKGVEAGKAALPDVAAAAGADKDEAGRPQDQQ